MPVYIDPLATPVTIQSRPCQQADWQHLMFTIHPLYPITIDHERHSPLTHSLPSIPPSSRSPSVRMPSSQVLVPHLFCSWKPHTLIANASIAMSQCRSLTFVTPCYGPQCSLSSLLLICQGHSTLTLPMHYSAPSQGQLVQLEVLTQQAV